MLSIEKRLRETPLQNSVDQRLVAIGVIASALYGSDNQISVYLVVQDLNHHSVVKRNRLEERSLSLNSQVQQQQQNQCTKKVKVKVQNRALDSHERRKKTRREN